MTTSVATLNTEVGALQTSVTNFGKDASGCAYEATVGDTGTSVPRQGPISVLYLPHDGR